MGKQKVALCGSEIYEQEIMEQPLKCRKSFECLEANVVLNSGDKDI